MKRKGNFTWCIYKAKRSVDYFIIKLGGKALCFLYNNLLCEVVKIVYPPPPKASRSTFLKPVNVTLHANKVFIDAMKLKILR